MSTGRTSEEQKAFEAKEAELNVRLQRIHERVAWIADTEARAAWVGGYGAKGEFDAERDSKISQAERVLDELAALGGSPKFQRK